jgi:hypothetical protein
VHKAEFSFVFPTRRRGLQNLLRVLFVVNETSHIQHTDQKIFAIETGRSCRTHIRFSGIDGAEKTKMRHENIAQGLSLWVVVICYLFDG